MFSIEKCSVPDNALLHCSVIARMAGSYETSVRTSSRITTQYPREHPLDWGFGALLGLHRVYSKALLCPAKTLLEGRNR